MQYSKLLIIILGLSLTSCSSDKGVLETSCIFVQEPIDEKRLELDRQKGIVLFKNSPFCGTSTLFEKAIKIASTEYRQGKKHGSTYKWFADGQISYEAYYSDGKKDSLSRTWWKNGNMRTESKFKFGVPHGVQLSWYRSGKKFKKINLIDGKEEGIQKAWRENGKVYNNYEAKNGRIFGLKRSNLCFKLEDEKIDIPSCIYSTGITLITRTAPIIRSPKPSARIIEFYNKTSSSSLKASCRTNILLVILGQMPGQDVKKKSVM